MRTPHAFQTRFEPLDSRLEWSVEIYFTLEVNGNDSVGRKTSGESPEKTNQLVVELSGYLYSWSIT